jgi:diguanylate cyclase (GGDEF)-like protein/PAS domain S-box-containing protein
MNKLSDNELCRLLYQEMPSVCLLLDEDLIIREVNEFGCQQLGYMHDELIGESFFELCYYDEHEYLEQNLRKCMADNSENHRWECMRLRKDGTRFWVRDTVRITQSENESKYILIAGEDITETRYLINELERKSAIDDLTGLYNRRKFDRFLEELVLSVQSNGGSHVLIYIDLDQFKVINDTCGHFCGDTFLRRVADLFRESIRDHDILARLGGDEFALILVNCSINEALKIAEKLLHDLSLLTFDWEDQIFSVGASIGCVEVDGAYLTAREYLNHADTACYSAKEKGRNRIQMYDLNDSEIEVMGNIQNWYGRLHRAVNNEDFVLYRQQILPLAATDENANCHEILIRMRGENGELVLPGAFIPAAEHYHLSSRIDRWVTETVIKRHQSVNQGDSVTYFINLSGLTLGDKVFIEEISKLLREQTDSKMKICFEITETTAIRNLNAASHFMNHFKKLGCMFALDDFGSGFSSFGYLKALQVDFIKIDGSFVRDITSDVLDKSVVQAIHQVATVFGKQTIAEFVETQAALDALESLGIEYVQGYHIEKPAPFSEEDK